MQILMDISHIKRLFKTSSWRADSRHHPRTHVCDLGGGKDKMPAAQRLLTLSWTLGICLVLRRAHPGNKQLLLPRAGEDPTHSVQEQRTCEATGQHLLLRPFGFIVQFLHNIMIHSQPEFISETSSLFQICMFLQVDVVSKEPPDSKWSQKQCVKINV